MIDININSSENITERETENGIVRFVKITKHGKDGKLIAKEIFTPVVVQAYETINYLRKLNDVSRVGLCIELALLNDETLKKEGFKGGSMDFIKECFGASLDVNTAQRYRKVGRVFGEKTVDEEGKVSYHWCDGIPEEATVTNLGQVIALVGLPKDYMKMTDDEIKKLRDKFMCEYIFTGKLHLDTINSLLRDEINALKEEVIPTTAEEVTETETETETDTETETETETETDNEETAKDNAISAIDTLKVYFKGNAKALKALATLAKEIG